jgi:DNA-binding NtrC family response regulator
VRIIASTNRDLEKEVAEGRFRQDLYYRLKVVPLVLPPLRERAEDIPELARHFMASSFAPSTTGRCWSWSPRPRRGWLQHSWPGNVRELKHAMERAVLLARGPRLTAADWRWSRTVRRSLAGPDRLLLQDRVDDATRRFVVEALERAGGEKKKAAELLGIDRVTLHRILRRLGLTPTWRLTSSPRLKLRRISPHPHRMSCLRSMKAESRGRCSRLPPWPSGSFISSRATESSNGLSIKTVWRSLANRGGITTLNT